MTIKILIAWLEAIALKNEDEFAYRIIVTPTRNGISYLFECEETADGHGFVSGVGRSIEVAIEDASRSIEDACKDWGYEFVPQPKQP